MKSDNVKSVETQNIASLKNRSLQQPQQQESAADRPKYKDRYRIETTRLKSWDYGANGYYFVTICVRYRECLLGGIQHGELILSDIGRVAARCWREIPEHFPFVCLDEFVVMPNHVHGIIIIDKPLNMDHVETQDFASLRHVNKTKQTQDFASIQNNNGFGPQSQNLASIIRGFKIGVKKWATLNEISFHWQPRYHDHIIRNEAELDRIREYIANNHLNWETDENYEC